jgi:ribosomal protein S9
MNFWSMKLNMWRQYCTAGRYMRYLINPNTVLPNCSLLMSAENDPPYLVFLFCPGDNMSQVCIPKLYFTHLRWLQLYLRSQSVQTFGRKVLIICFYCKNVRALNTLTLSQKTAVAVAHCKSGNGSIKLNGTEMLRSFLSRSWTMRFWYLQALASFRGLDLQTAFRCTSGTCSARYFEVQGFWACALVGSQPPEKLGHQAASQGRRSCISNLWCELQMNYCRLYYTFHMTNSMLCLAAIRQALSKAIVAFYQKCRLGSVNIEQ